MRKHRRLALKTESGRRNGTFLQALTRNVGYTKLTEHLGAFVAYMCMSKNDLDFIEKLDRFRPRIEKQLSLPLEYERDKDDGKDL